MKGSTLHSTTSRFRKILIVPSIVIVLTAGLLTAGLASRQTTPAANAAVGRASAAVINALTAKANTNRTTAGKAILVAMAQRGDMYLWGAVGPNRFDCSGLTMYSYKRAGKSIPRTSTSQRLWTRTVAFDGKKPGDLTFYNGHVAMYVGFSHGQHWMIQAPHAGAPVEVVPLRTRGLLKVGRVR